jgi:hypothetical protein
MRNDRAQRAGEKETTEGEGSSRFVVFVFSLFFNSFFSVIQDYVVSLHPQKTRVSFVPSSDVFYFFTV